MEITVISAQGLKKSSSSTLFSKRIKPFITLDTVPPYSCKSINGDKPIHVYKTTVDDKGGVNPMWNDTFHLPVDGNFWYQKYPCVYLQLYTKNLMVGRTQLGWCPIPAADIVDGFPPAGEVRHLSYRLRERDGSRGHGVVNIKVKVLEGSFQVGCPQRPLVNYDVTHLPEKGLGQTVMGFPVTMLPAGGW